MNTNQRKIYDFLHKKGESSKKEIASECMGNYYTNGMFHFGLILTRMVNARYIERTRKGYYKAVDLQINAPKNQTKLNF